MRRDVLIVAVVMAGLVLAAHGRAVAVPVSVSNYSFEGHDIDGDGIYNLNPGSGGGVPGNDPNNNRRDYDNIVPGWDLYCALYTFEGTRNPSGTLYTGADGNNAIPKTGTGNPHGKQTAYMHRGAGVGNSDWYLTTTTSAVIPILGGADYTLTVAVGTPLVIGGNTNPRVSRIDITFLRADTGATIATVGSTSLPAPGQWADFTLSLPRTTIASQGLAGGTMKIELHGKVNSLEKRSVDFDNVRLERTEVAQLSASPAPNSTIDLGDVAVGATKILYSAVSLQNIGETGTSLTLQGVTYANETLPGRFDLAAGNPNAVLVAGGSSTEVFDVRFNASGLTSGDYLADITFANDSPQGNVTYTLKARVTAPIAEPAGLGLMGMVLLALRRRRG